MLIFVGLELLFSCEREEFVRSQGCENVMVLEMVAASSM